ncbi:hypothetical protein HanIR_Chr17g0896191 [Helianthus annuus]|nr:hypothetical protein HanIR_Chr17g0896191 [Helianthus annuus]
MDRGGETMPAQSVPVPKNMDTEEKEYEKSDQVQGCEPLETQGGDGLVNEININEEPLEMDRTEDVHEQTSVDGTGYEVRHIYCRYQ